MKKKILLLITLFITTFTFGQNCHFRYSNAGALNVFTFIPDTTFHNPHHYVLWNFGDGNWSSDTLPSHAYNSLGRFNVCFSIYDANQTLICSWCDSVTPGTPSSGSCNFTSTAISNNSFVFQTHTGSASHTVWDFGDNSTGTGDSIPHTYNHTGTYLVCMNEVDDNSGSILCTHCSHVTVNSTTANCSFFASVDTLHGTAVFYAQPSASGSIISWDFGNGVVGTGNVFTFTSLGTYRVCMTETNSAHAVLCSYCDSVTIGHHVNTNCSFTSLPDAQNPSLIYFTSNVAAGSTVVWSFGDNSTLQSGLNVSHVYNSTGPFRVCMTSTLNGASCTSCDSVRPGSVHSNCTFTYMHDPVHDNIVSFAASVSAPGTAITWNFGDGSSGSGMTASHVFPASGTYTVCMYESDSTTHILRCSTCLHITVTLTTPGCQAYYIGVNAGLTGYFIDLSNVNPGTATYTWYFGDNTFSHTRFPHHTYSTQGTYYVCLSVADQGCTDQYCSWITVDSVINHAPVCNAFFTTVQLAPFQFVVVNLSNGVNPNFTWDFGDGSPTSSLAYPSHFYTSTGSYNLCLTVSNSTCTSTYCDTLSVDALGNVFRGQAGFTINVLSPDQLTGVPEVSALKFFDVYPNPVTSALTVSLADDMNRGATYTYTVYALDGTEVTTGKLSAAVSKLNVERWHSGLYILEVRNDAGFKSYQKIIKQ